MRHFLPVLALIATARLVQDRWVPTQAWLDEPRPYGRPRDGFVQKKSTAIAIGEAIVADKYGDDFRRECAPYDAKRFGDVWVVYGYARLGKPGNPMVGGTVAVQISASTGTILNSSIDQ